MFCGCILLQRKIYDTYPRLPFRKDGHMVWKEALTCKCHAFVLLCLQFLLASTKATKSNCSIGLVIARISDTT